MNQEILNALRDNPMFRERVHKNHMLGRLIFEKYGIEMSPKLNDLMADLVTDIQNADRYWRMHTLAYPDLRGSDYDTKKKVEQEKMLALGYETGYANDIKA